MKYPQRVPISLSIKHKYFSISEFIYFLLVAVTPLQDGIWQQVMKEQVQQQL